jgi:hypothetical protein
MTSSAPAPPSGASSKIPSAPSTNSSASTPKPTATVTRFSATAIIGRNSERRIGTSIR